MAKAKEKAVEKKAVEKKAVEKKAAEVQAAGAAHRAVRNTDQVKIMSGKVKICEGTRTACKATLFPKEVNRSSSLHSLLVRNHPEYHIIYPS